MEDMYWLLYEAIPTSMLLDDIHKKWAEDIRKYLVKIDGMLVGWMVSQNPLKNMLISNSFHL